MPAAASTLFRLLAVRGTPSVSHRSEGSMNATGLFAGPAHVLVDGDETFRTRVPAWAFGLPAREAFPEWTHVHEIMDAVLRTGSPQEVNLPSARLLLVRVPAVHGRPGIVAHATLRSPLLPPPVYEGPQSLRELLEAR